MNHDPVTCPICIKDRTERGQRDERRELKAQIFLSRSQLVELKCRAWLAEKLEAVALLMMRLSCRVASGRPE